MLKNAVGKIFDHAMLFGAGIIIPTTNKKYQISHKHISNNIQTNSVQNHCKSLNEGSGLLIIVLRGKKRLPVSLQSLHGSKLTSFIHLAVIFGEWPCTTEKQKSRAS